MQKILKFSERKIKNVSLDFKIYLYEDIEKLQETLNLFWINFSFDKFTTKEYQKLLELIEKIF